MSEADISAEIERRRALWDELVALGGRGRETSATSG